MKLYVVQEIKFDYDDEWHSEAGLGKPVKAFKSKANAEHERAELNAKAVKEQRLRTEDGDVTDYYRVVEVEAEEGEVTYATAREAVEAARKAAQKLVKAAFEQGATALFAANPELKSFDWTQYTPYFNDGEPCEFGVYRDEPGVNGVGGYEITDGLDHHYDEKERRYVTTRVAPEPVEHVLQTKVAEFLGQFAEDDLKSLFGDHVRVTVVRGRGGKAKASTDEYSHD